MLKNMMAGLFVVVFFLGCGNDSVAVENIKPELVVGNNVSSLEFQDQFDKKHTIGNENKYLVLAFSKKVGHEVNDYLATQKPTFLKDHQALFISDLSAAPSLIRSMFILPGLKDFKYEVLVITDENRAKAFQPQEKMKEHIMIVTLNQGVIQEIRFIDKANELDKAL